MESLLQEQVRQQLLNEPGKRASMRRLLSQGKVSKLLKHLSKMRQTPITKLPEELCDILRKVATVFEVSEVEGSAVQDVRVSLTEAGEKEPVVEQKHFETLWASMIDVPEPQALPVNPPSAPLPPPKPPQVPPVIQPAKNLYQPKKFFPKAFQTENRQAFQQTLQQLQELDQQKLHNSGAEKPERPAFNGPQPPDHPPPGYKADWKRFTPTAKRVLAPRRENSGPLEGEDEGQGTGPAHPGGVGGPVRWVPGPSAPPSAPASRPPTPNMPTGTPMPGAHALDNEGRPYDLERVVVNFANVGATFGVRVLKRVKDRDYLFDYEGVRRCVRHLTQKRGLRVIGVIFENFHGAGEWPRCFPGGTQLLSTIVRSSPTMAAIARPRCSRCLIQVIF